MTLKQLLLQNKKQFGYYLLGALLTPVLGIFFTLALSNTFGIIEETTSQGILRRLGFVVFFAFSPALIQLASRFLRIGFMRDIMIAVRTLAYDKVMSNTVEQYNQQPIEQHMSMLVSDVNLFEKDFFLSLLNIVYAFGTSIIGAAILWFVSPIMSISTLLVSFILYVLTRVFKPIALKAKKKTQEANAYYNSELTNTLHGLEVIKLFQVETNFIRPFRSIVCMLEQVKQKAFLIDQIQANLNEWIAGTFQVIMYVYATYLYIQNEISLTLLIVVFNLVGQLLFTMISGFNFINRIQTSSDIFDRITAYQDVSEGVYQATLTKGIVLNNVSFAYDENVVLNNLTFSIKPKEKVLITGPSGVGKTTLLNCLTQNITSYDGDIYLDDTNLKDINNTSFLRLCGYVHQHHFLFADTIKNNIVLEAEYDRTKLETILKQVDLWDWISTLENNVDHCLTQNGTNISGGQRQRISIARELYQERDVLFVDEPSASLDDMSALKVYDTLLSLDKTLVCVSHRHLDYLASKVDQVIQLDYEGGVKHEKA